MVRSPPRCTRITRSFPTRRSADLNFIRGSEAIVRGVEASGVRRLVVIGGAGSLFVAPDIQLVDTDLFAAHVTPNIALGARAARDALNTMRSNTTLDWTFVSPPAFLEDRKSTRLNSSH